MSITTRCSTWSLVLATSAGGDLASCAGSPVRGAVPASGCDGTVRPVDRDEQLRRGAEEARRWRTGSSTRTTPSAGAARRGGRSAGSACTAISRAITALTSRPSRTAVACRLDRVEVVLDGRHRLDRGTSRPPAAAASGGAAPRRRRRSPSTQRPAVGASCRRRPPGTTTSPGSPGSNGTQPRAIGPRPQPGRAGSRRRGRSTPAHAGASSTATRAATPRPANPTPSRTNRKPSPRAMSLRSRRAGGVVGAAGDGAHQRYPRGR